VSAPAYGTAAYRVLRALVNAGVAGLTAHEAAGKVTPAIYAHTANNRLAELARLDLAVRTDETRLTDRQRPARVYRARPAAVDAVRTAEASGREARSGPPEPPGAAKPAGRAPLRPTPGRHALATTHNRVLEELYYAQWRAVNDACTAHELAALTGRLHTAVGTELTALIAAGQAQRLEVTRRTPSGGQAHPVRLTDRGRAVFRALVRPQ